MALGKQSGKHHHLGVRHGTFGQHPIGAHHPALGAKPSAINARNVGIAAVIILILAIAYLLLQPSGVHDITSNSTVTMDVNSSYNFMLPDNSSVASIFLASASDSGATLYLSRLPVLEGDIYVIQIQKGEVINVSVYGGSSADLQISLISGSSGGAIVSLYYIPYNLNLHPATLQLLGANSSMQTTSPTTTVSAVTTAGQGTTSATTKPTTTVAAQTGSQAALAIANSSIYGVLVNNYKELYQKEASQCTPSTYNTTFIETQEHSPSGPNTYQNVSYATPTSITSSIEEVSSGVYNITYIAIIGIGNTPSLRLEVNSGTKSITTSEFEGIFQDLTYSSALSQYQSFNQSTNPCELYVP